MKTIDTKPTAIKWIDSGMESGWRDISGGFSGAEIIVESLGVIIYEDEKIISLAHNFSNETENSSLQVNGVMTIPKCSVISRVTLNALENESEQEPSLQDV